MYSPDSSIGDTDTTRLLRACADAVPQILCATDAAGCLLFANAFFREYTGLSLEAPDAAALENTIHPDDLSLFRNIRDARLGSGAAWEEQFRLRRGDGEYRLHLNQFVATRNKDGDITHWIVRATDIDYAPWDEWENEKVQALSQQRELAFRAARIGVWDWDVVAERGHWSPEQRQLFGLPPQYEGEYGEFYEFVHPEDCERVRGEMQAVLFQTGDTEYEHEFRILHGISGEALWIQGRGRIHRNADGEPLRITGINMDVSERVHAEAALAESLRKQTRIVQELQQSLLLTPPKNAFAGIELGTLYEAAWDEAQVGGDFYDAFAVSDTLICLVVGDVTGKGLGAARFTAEAKFALRAYVQETQDVSRSLGLLNRFLCHRRERSHDEANAFIAVSAIILDTRTGHGVCALGGMECPLIYRASARAFEEVDVRGIVLGADAGATYDPVAQVLLPGDMVIITTDGITEARSTDKQFFELAGIARCVEDALGAAPDESPENIAQACLHGAKEWASGKLSDDACLLIARFVGRGANMSHENNDR